MIYQGEEKLQKSTHWGRKKEKQQRKGGSSKMDRPRSRCVQNSLYYMQMKENVI